MRSLGGRGDKASSPVLFDRGYPNAHLGAPTRQNRRQLSCIAGRGRGVLPTARDALEAAFGEQRGNPENLRMVAVGMDMGTQGPPRP